jgi:hypothetical protein
MWFVALARAVRGDASVPNDPILIEELTEVKHFVNKRGRIQIEDKEDLRDSTRLGRSPNRADAWIMLQYGFEKASPMNREKYNRDSKSRSGEVTSACAGKGGMAA